ncbi:MAG TPA: hypothetical protein VGG29_05375 [Caulobacteraceae bacterium]|jgi:hypothetical protein
MARITCLAAAALALPGAALATPASEGPAPTTAAFSLSGAAPKACGLGTAGQSTLDIGEMVDASTGELAAISNPPSTSITGSWCNTASTVSVVATPLVAQSFAGQPPTGFTKAVNYTATVSAWSTNAAAFATNGNEAGVQRDTTPGSQPQPAPTATTIDVAVGSFAAPAASDFLVADTDYSGAITITLTPNS